MRNSFFMKKCKQLTCQNLLKNHKKKLFYFEPDLKENQFFIFIILFLPPPF
jgi:hypothetical protein